MRNFRFFTIILVTICILGLSLATAGEKIPVTTSSKKALELFMKGRDLQERLQGQESIEYFQKAVAEDPDFAMAWYYLALVSPSAKDFFANLEKAKENAGKVSEGEKMWITGVDAGVNGMAMKQREIYTNLTEKFPKDERALNLLGNHYFGQQDYLKAVEFYEKAIKVNPQFSQPYNQLGYAQRFLKNYEKAEKAFQKYIELIPDDPNPYDSYAELLMKTGRYDESIEQYKKALTHNPNFVASHIGIATDLNFKGNHKAAREQLKQLMKIARNDGEKRAAHFATVVSYVDEGGMKKSLEELNMMFKIAEKNKNAPGMAGDHVATGNILMELGNTEKAMKHFENALDIVINSDLKEQVKSNFRRGFLYNNTRVMIAKNDLATAKIQSEEHRKLVEEIKNPLQIKLNHELMGRIAYAEKDFTKAIEEFKQCNLQNPYNLYRLAMAYQANGDTKMAQEYLTQAREHNTLNSLNYAFARNKMKEAAL